VESMACVQHCRWWQLPCHYPELRRWASSRPRQAAPLPRSRSALLRALCALHGLFWPPGPPPSSWQPVFGGGCRAFGGGRVKPSPRGSSSRRRRSRSRTGGRQPPRT